MIRHLPRALSELRKQASQSLEDLASSLAELNPALSEETLKAWEAGLATPKLEELLPWLECLGTDLASLQNALKAARDRARRLQLDPFEKFLEEGHHRLEADPGFRQTFEDLAKGSGIDVSVQLESTQELPRRSASTQLLDASLSTLLLPTHRYEESRAFYGRLLGSGNEAADDGFPLGTVRIHLRKSEAPVTSLTMRWRCAEPRQSLLARLEAEMPAPAPETAEAAELLELEDPAGHRLEILFEDPKSRR